MMSKSIGPLFMEKTMYKNMPKTPRQNQAEKPPLQMPYSGTPIDLPNPMALEHKDVALDKAMIDRKSHRKYTDQTLNLKEVSYLLYVSQGVKKTTENNTFRTVPSAGASHAFETYILIRNVVDLSPGLYRYLALEHQLLKVSDDPNLTTKVKVACLDQPMIETSALTFLWVADIKRMHYKYGERGYRFIFLDAGHVCQNIYLACENLGAGTVAIAAYDDTAVNAVLKLDGEAQFVTYIAPVGKI